jgi:transcriptional regulator with XRE-family HTH domain
MARRGFEDRFPQRESPAVQALATKVRELRKARGIGQIELAKEIGLDQNAISLIENGRANPTLTTLEFLADAFDVTLIELLGAVMPAKTAKKPPKKLSDA